MEGIRRSRTGRILVALRDNEDGTEAFGVSAIRAKLTAFAISGFIAAVAGAVATHNLNSFSPGSADFNLIAFTGAVLGGLGTSAGAVLGALYFQGTFSWLRAEWRLFASATGVLFVLWAAPSGLHGLWQDLRDLVLRWLGGRRGITDADLAEDLLGDADPTVPTELEEAAS